MSDIGFTFKPKPGAIRVFAKVRAQRHGVSIDTLKLTDHRAIEVD
jgi:hypothetical protein